MFMEKFAPHCYALLRIVTGFLFLWHGSQKSWGIRALCQMECPFILPTSLAR